MTSRQRTRHVVGPVADFPPGTRRFLEIDRRSIVVFNVDGRFYAVRNRCPHQGAPLGMGTATRTTSAQLHGDDPPQRCWRDDRPVIRCPWHAWEFDLETGQAVFGEGWRIATYRAFVDGGAGDEPRQGLRDGVPGPADTFRTTVESGNVVVEV